MKRSALPLQSLASTATITASMSTRSSYRGGRKQWGRGFSDRPYNQGRGRQFVTGDSHFQDSNSGNYQVRSGGYDPRQLPRPPPRYNPNQQLRQPPPFIQNQNNQFRRSPRFDQNNHATRPPQQFRPRPPDYRDWEYAKAGPPPGSEKFIVLSYNILADYLAINHRSKLYFHIPRYMLDWEWRKRSILFELNLWSADIMCLQEVDRFQDLVKELKPRGYDGIWKMRTGNAVDGCAIFWRTSRFKLLYEESIEFNQLGLRDNVAQICVLEQLTKKSRTANTSDLPISPESNDKVLVCNIHVLYNPKRGEIKLGQVRTLLDKANDVAKMWNAPVVLCGDFNCTPKSPLYNFILEQKLDLSGIDRDKISGQASAEIRPSWPRNSKLNPSPNSNPVPDQSSSEKSNQGPAVTGEKTEETQQNVIDNCKEDLESTISVLADSFNKASISDNSDDKDLGNEEVVQRSVAPPSFYFEGENEFNEESPREVNIQLEGEMLVEDRDAFLKGLDDSEFSSQLDSSQSGQPDASDPVDFEVDSPTNEAVNDLSNDMDRTPYDPSVWTHVEVAVATGNEECTVLQHPLKLKSSYAEVEDCSGTRDSNGEPLVTSYNRCFLGTVDYIWSSEGLQTVRVLAPIPKPAMQWTPGFPTKKWGSDHIALASELAFTKDVTNNMAEVQHHED